MSGGCLVTTNLLYRECRREPQDIFTYLNWMLLCAWNCVKHHWCTLFFPKVMKNISKVQSVLPPAPFHPFFSKGCYDPGRRLDSTLVGMGLWRDMTFPVTEKIFWQWNMYYNVNVVKPDKSVHCCKQKHFSYQYFSDIQVS